MRTWWGWTRPRPSSDGQNVVETYAEVDVGTRVARVARILGDRSKSGAKETKALRGKEAEAHASLKADSDARLDG